MAKGKYDQRKQSLYFCKEMLAEIRREASRLDRSVSWVVQYAWRNGGKHSVFKLQSVETE